MIFEIEDWILCSLLFSETHEALQLEIDAKLKPRSGWRFWAAIFCDHAGLGSRFCTPFFLG